MGGRRENGLDRAQLTLQILSGGDPVQCIARQHGMRAIIDLGPDLDVRSSKQLLTLQDGLGELEAVDVAEGCFGVVRPLQGVAQVDLVPGGRRTP